MNLKTKLILSFLSYILIFTATLTFLKLWDFWKCLLLSRPADFSAALASLDFAQILVIALPVAVALSISKYKNLKTEVR